MGVVRCLLAGCYQKRTPNSTLSFHKFPSDSERRRTWLSATNLSQREIKANSVICAKHFKASDYFPNNLQDKKLLRREAVPKLYICKQASGKNFKTEIKKNVKTVVKKGTEIKKTKNEGVKLNSGNKRKETGKTDKTLMSRRRPTNSQQSKIVKKTVSRENKELKTKQPQIHSYSIKRKESHNKDSEVKKFKAENNKNAKGKVQTKEISEVQPGPDIDKHYWTSIHETITEMQEKIKSLETKSVQDEQKIEDFQKVLIQQRKEEIKALIEGKENELILRMDVLCLDYDPKRICRLCLLEKGGPLIPLFQPKRKALIIEKIKTWTGIKIEEEDGMPSGICYACSIQMERADWFKKRSEKADVLLKKFIQMKKPANNTVESALQIQQISGVKIEIEDVFSLTNMVEEPNFEVSVKEEIEDLSFVEESDSFNNVTKPTLQSFNPKKKFCTKCNKPAYKCLQKKAHSLECFECGKVFWDAQARKRHQLLRIECVVPLHKRTCNVCNIIFRWKWQLNIHCWQHCQVKCHACVICEEQFTYISQLKLHVATHFH